MGDFGFTGPPTGDLGPTIGLWNQIEAQLNFLVSWIVATFNALIGALATVFRFIGLLFKKIGQALHHLWEVGLKKLIYGTLNWIHRAAHWLEMKLRPIIKFLKEMRRRWDRYYRLHVLPIINLIQKIRRWLLFLRLLHIGFAQKLDKFLLKLEVRLNKNFLTIRGYLNLALSWASLATNPVSLGRLVLVSVAGRRSTAALCRAITGLPIGHFFPSSARDRFPFEQQPRSAKDYTDPARNPPASQILLPLLDGFTDGSFSEAPGPSDQDIDEAGHLEWGDEFVATLQAEEAAADLLTDTGFSLWDAISQRKGNLYDVTAPLAADLVGQTTGGSSE